MKEHDLILIFGAFASEAIGTMSGFGSSTLFVPFGVLFESFYFILALTSILHCFGNVSKIYLFKESFNKRLFLQMFIPSIVMTGIGASLVSVFPVDLLKKLLGLILIAVSIFWFLGREKKWLTNPKLAFVLIGGSGFSTGLVGTGGALRGLALSALQLDKSAFVMLSASIDFVGDFFRMLIYLKSGFMDWQQWFYVPLLGLAAFLGVRLGRLILRSLSQKIFDRLVLILVFGSGILMLFGL